MNDITLPVASLKVLSSRKRFQILRLLLQRRMTATELADALRMPKGTVHTHLSQLARAGFVLQHKGDRLWVYYSLTPMGQALASAERPRIVIQLAAGVGLSTVGALALLAFRPQPVGSDTFGLDGGGSHSPVNGTFSPGAPAETTALVASGLALAAGLVLLVGLGWRGWRALRRWSTPAAGQG